MTPLQLADEIQLQDSCYGNRFQFWQFLTSQLVINEMNK